MSRLNQKIGVNDAFLLGFENYGQKRKVRTPRIAEDQRGFRELILTKRKNGAP